MLQPIVTFISVLALTVFAPACSQTEPREIAFWSVQIKTSGGFDGIGRGNIFVSSDGKMTYQKAAVPGKTERPCDGKLSSEEVRTISEAVKQSKPDEWKIDGLNFAAPDAFGYRLELVIDGTTHKVQWYDNTGGQLPSDLKKLYAAVNTATKVAVKTCGG